MEGNSKRTSGGNEEEEKTKRDRRRMQRQRPTHIARGRDTLGVRLWGKGAGAEQPPQTQMAKYRNMRAGS